MNYSWQNMGSERSAVREWDEAIEYVSANQESLMAEYGNNIVAVKGRKVVAFGRDYEEVIKQLDDLGFAVTEEIPMATIDDFVFPGPCLT